MQQLVFDLSPVPNVQFDSFIHATNAEVVSALTQEPPERFIYLWGEAGGGKTHLLKAWQARSEGLTGGAIYIDARTERIVEATRSFSWIAIDHIDDLMPDEAIAFFSLYHALQERRSGALLAAGRYPPAKLKLRADVCTRLGSALVFEVKLLADEEKLAVLCAQAQRRQLSIHEDVFRYLLSHWRRDLPHLLALLETLDRYSLALHCPITVTLVKRLLASTPLPASTP